MKLELNLRRIRSSIRTDINTGSRTQSGGKGYGVNTGFAQTACMDNRSAVVCADDQGSRVGQPGPTATG